MIGSQIIDGTSIAENLLGKMEFRFPFRKYQKVILQQIETNKDTDRRFHIVAPPGSGKTIIGLELIRRFGQPAVVFAPTSTIQLQWKEKIGMFIPEGKKICPSDVAGVDTVDLKPINIFTYQLISSPAENLQFVEEAALFEWQDHITGGHTSLSFEEAKERIDLLKRNNPKTYSKELSKYYKKIKGRYMRDPQFDGIKFLHQNAVKLINGLVAYGVKVVVLDEVHHLLDYWALVIKELLRRIENPILIGLTATPPVSAGDEELANYLSIIGAIDFEIPTPAVVKEGNLAPYQDLVFFCRPTPAEKEFINSIQKRFTHLIEDIGNRQSFQDWVKKRILERPSGNGKKQEWTSFFNGHLFLAIAGSKYLEQFLKEDLPGDIVKVEEMEREICFDDWVYLLADYCLNYLKLSREERHHDELREIKRVLRSFGYALSEKGIRRRRSPTDKVLALSDSKNAGVIRVLQTELAAMGDDLRAVVITDFEKQSSTSKFVSGILDDESGGAVKTFRYLAHDPICTQLEPILVTGTAVLADADKLDTILAEMKAWRRECGLKFDLSTRKTAYKKIVEITGSGSDWRPNTYVRMVTALFEKGVVRCMIGTRGLLGEGWDSLRLNTLIDLTSATTSMTVNQLRGRSIRLDTKNLQKLANNWDIVCIDPSFEKGDHDFKRFLKKHNQFYGLGSKGKIVKGFLHVDEELCLLYHSIGFKRIMYHHLNKRMLAKARNRQAAYLQWRVGMPYSNFEYSATKLDARDIKFKTVFTLRDSLKAIFNNILVNLSSFAMWYASNFRWRIRSEYVSPVMFLIVSSIFFFGALLVCGRNIKKYVKKAFIELPLDSFLGDIGKALLRSLRESGLIDASQSVDNIRVVEDGAGYYDLYLDYAKPEDSRLFSTSLKELLTPVTDQRYLISRSIDDIKIGFYSPIWWFLRKMFRLARQERIAYHPVPELLATNKKRAASFAKNWREYVGGGRLIYTRSRAGSELLLELRRHNRHKVKQVNFEIWT